MRTVHCICCNKEIAQDVTGPFLAICDGCADHEDYCIDKAVLEVECGKVNDLVELEG